MSEESPPTYTTPIFNQAYFGTTDGEIDTAYLNSHYLRYPIAQTGLETIANLATTNDATINGLTVGRGAGSNSTNTALGVDALDAITSGSANIAIGNNTLKNATLASKSVAIGSNTLILNTTGNQNTAVGNSSMTNNITGGDNTAVGHFSLTSNTGSDNVAVGFEALSSNTSGSRNTAIGYRTGKVGTANTTGTNNTFVGYGAKTNGSGYTNSTALGSDAEITASNQIVLGTTTETVVIPNQINFSYTSNPTLAVGSIGYTYSSSISSITVLNNSSGLLSTISSVPIGVYLVQYLTTYYDVVGTANNTRIKTFAGITSFGTQIASNNVVYFTANDYISATLSVVYTNTAVSNFQLNCAVNGSATSIKSYISEGGYFRATRIA